MSSVPSPVSTSSSPSLRSANRQCATMRGISLGRKLAQLR